MTLFAFFFVFFFVKTFDSVGRSDTWAGGRSRNEAGKRRNSSLRKTASVLNRIRKAFSNVSVASNPGNNKRQQQWQQQQQRQRQPQESSRTLMSRSHLSTELDRPLSVVRQEAGRRGYPRATFTQVQVRHSSPVFFFRQSS